MKLYIYGAGESGNALAIRLRVERPNWQVLGFYDKFKTGTCQGLPIRPLAGADTAVRVVISIQHAWRAMEAYHTMRDMGVQDIWWYQENRQGASLLPLADCLCDLQDWGTAVLPQAEIHLSDACNLNCVGCTHYAPIFHELNADFDQKIADVKLMASKFSHVAYFYLLGGEPLLNQELDRYVVAIRDILPTTNIGIVTNGLLLLQVPDTLLECVREQRVKIIISEYEPTHTRIDEIVARLEKFHLLYERRTLDKKTLFNKPLTLSSHTKHKLKCISDGCVNIYNGKICRCPQLMYVERFNEEYQQHLPTEGIMDLTTCGSGRELLAKLRQPVPLCQHCIENSISWQRCQGKPRLEDFAVCD